MSAEVPKRWQCLVCGYVHEGRRPPESCPRCGANLNRFVLLEALPPELEALAREAFAGESKAHVRNLAFARRATEEGYPQVAALFAAVAEAERVHAAEALGYLAGQVGDTEQNLRAAFEHELAARSEHYPPIIAAALAAGREDLAYAMIRARDVEARHAKLYKDALEALVNERTVVYHVCQVCGYVFEDEPPDNCPVCLAARDKFKRMV